MNMFATDTFNYSPSHHVPFRDKQILERMRRITREDFVQTIKLTVKPPEGYISHRFQFGKLHAHGVLW